MTETTFPKTATPQAQGTKPATTNRGATILKMTLAVGSVVATLMGADLMARQDQGVATTPVLTTARAADAAVNAPQQRSNAVSAVPNLPAAPHLNTPDVNTLLNTPLVPIAPRSRWAPVTRSRSSR